MSAMIHQSANGASAPEPNLSPRLTPYDATCMHAHTAAPKTAPSLRPQSQLFAQAHKVLVGQCSLSNDVLSRSRCCLTDAV